MEGLRRVSTTATEAVLASGIATTLEVDLVSTP